MTSNFDYYENGNVEKIRKTPEMKTSGSLKSKIDDDTIESIWVTDSTFVKAGYIEIKVVHVLSLIFSPSKLR